MCTLEAPHSANLQVNQPCQNLHTFKAKWVLGQPLSSKTTCLLSRLLYFLAYTLHVCVCVCVFVGGFYSLWIKPVF